MLRSLTFAALGSIAVATLTGCAPCGGEVPEPTAVAVLPQEVAATGAEQATGEGSADAPSAIAPMRVESVGSLEPLGALAAASLVDDVVVRVTSDTLHLDALPADSPPREIARHTLQGDGDVARVALRLPWAVVLRAERPAAPGQPSVSGSLELVFFDGIPHTTMRSLPGAPVDAWVTSPPTHVWVLVRRGREGELLRLPLNHDLEAAPDVRLAMSNTPVGIQRSADDSQLLVPCFDGRAVHIVDVASGEELHRVGVDIRPTTADLRGDVLTIAAPNAAQARVVRLSHGSDGQIATLPFAPTAWAFGEGVVAGGAAGPGAVARFEPPWLRVVASREDLGSDTQVIPLAMHVMEDTLWVVDGSPSTPTLWALDVASLSVRARVPLDAAPGVSALHQGDVLTLSSTTGAASRWRAVADEAVREQ